MKGFRACLISPLFDYKGTESQRLEGKNFVALCLGDFVVKLLNSLLVFTREITVEKKNYKPDFPPPSQKIS